MRTWTRASLECRCGRCGQPIAKGDALVRITLPAVGHALLRCQACEAVTEGTTPPANLSVPANLSARAPSLDFTRLGLLPLDFSRRKEG